MPVANIQDFRTCPLNVNVDAVYEPCFHDNEGEGATQFEDGPGPDEFTIDELYDTTVALAIAYANKFTIPVTLYLYDKGSRPVGPTTLSVNNT